MKYCVTTRNVTIIAGVVILATSLVCSESVDRVDQVRAALPTKTRRLCRAVVDRGVSVELFTQTALMQQWASRVMLAVPVEKGDGLPSCICRKCMTRVEVLEKSSRSLE